MFLFKGVNQEHQAIVYALWQIGNISAHSATFLPCHIGLKVSTFISVDVS